MTVCPRWGGGGGGWGLGNNWKRPGGCPLGSSLQGQMHPTGFWAGTPHTGTLARREPGGRRSPKPPQSRKLASPVAPPALGILCSEEGEVHVPAQDQRRTQSHCQVGQGVPHSLYLVSKYLRDLSDLITQKRTYLVNVISDLY